MVERASEQCGLRCAGMGCAGSGCTGVGRARVARVAGVPAACVTGGVRDASGGVLGFFLAGVVVVGAAV